MLKSILIGTIVIVLLGALAVGFYDSMRGASSFSLPQWNSAQAQGQGGGHQGQGQGRGNGQGQGQGRGQGQGQGQGNGQGRGRGGNGQGQGQGQGTPVEHTWVTLQGTVSSFDGQQTLSVETGERGQLDLWLGPTGYAAQQGVIFNPGDAVTILGFDSPNGSFQAGEITNNTSGTTLYLRDPNGRPLWAGQGNGQGRGHGDSGLGRQRGRSAQQPAA